MEHFRLDDFDHPKEHDTTVDEETSFSTPGVDTALTAGTDAAVTDVTPTSLQNEQIQFIVDSYYNAVAEKEG